MHHDRIHQLHQLSGPHRNFSQVAYESESDSDERDCRGGHPPAIAFARSNRPQQRLPKLLLNDQKPSAARGFAQVSQAIPREDTSALRGSRSSGPLRQSSAAATSSGPPSPWADGETKKRIIDALKDEHSDIHLLIGDETTTGCAVNYAKIQEVYAPKHDKNRFRQNFQRLIKNKKEMTGPFKVMTSTKKKSTNEIEPWYTSSKRTCLGYTLLHDMYVKQPNVINPMTAEEIWKSQPEFQKYPLQDFKKYNKNMKALVSQKVRRAATEEAIYQEDMRHHTHKEITCRGTPFWNKHAAKAMLIKDVEDGIGRTMKPRQLWESREEYQAFPYEFFRKRVYEVRQKALAAPYWQVKRNKSGKELHRLQTNEMREKWALDVQVEKITDMLNRGLAF